MPATSGRRGYRLQEAGREGHFVEGHRHRFAAMTLAYIGTRLQAIGASIVTAVRPGRTVEAVTAPGSQFLDERLSDAPSRDVLASRRWSAVVFQAQKYSSSGQFSYSTAEAAACVAPVPQAVIDLSPRLYCPADTFPG